MVCIYLHEAAMTAVFPVAAAISNVTERRHFKPGNKFVCVCVFFLWRSSLHVTGNTVQESRRQIGLTLRHRQEYDVLLSHVHRQIWTTAHCTFVPKYITFIIYYSKINKYKASAYFKPSVSYLLQWYKQPTRCNNNSLLMVSISSQLNMFRAIISPILRSTLMCLQLVV